MAIRDEIRKERQSYFATATRAEKIKYIRDYYGMWILGGLIAITLISWMIYDSVTKPETILNGTFLNLYSHNTTDTVDDLGECFLKDQGIDTSEYATLFVSNLFMTNGEDITNFQTSQALLTQISAGALDFIVAPSDNLITYAYDRTLVDLSTVLTDEQMQLYEPYFRYVDRAIVTLRSDTQDFENPATIELPDYNKPEAMKQPIPVMIDLTQCETITKLYGMEVPNLCIGIVSTGENQENALKFLDYIMKE